LILVSLGVVVAVIAESVIALHNFAWVEWRGAFIAGMVFKFALLSTILHLSEELLRYPCFRRVAFLCHLLKLYVYAHRMARDLLTSSLILLALSPFVLLDSLNSCCCIGFSVHHLLIYRDPGRPARENLEGLRWNQGRTQMWHSSISFWDSTEKSDMSSEKADMTRKAKTAKTPKSVKSAKSAKSLEKSAKTPRSRYALERQETDEVETDLIGAKSMFYDAQDSADEEVDVAPTDETKDEINETNDEIAGSYV